MSNVVPLGFPVLGPLCEQIKEHFRDAEPRTPRRTIEQEREDREAEAQDRTTSAFNDIKFAILGHISDSKALVPNWRMTPHQGMAFGRETEIQTPMAEVIAFVMDDAPVLEALRALTANPCRETADAFEMAVATQFASHTYEGLADARMPN